MGEFLEKFSTEKDLDGWIQKIDKTLIIFYTMKTLS
jgi:hypothetical protein